MSKGDGRRPRSLKISTKRYDKNFEDAFGRTDNHEQEKSVQDQPTCTRGNRGEASSEPVRAKERSREDSRLGRYQSQGDDSNGNSQ